MGLAIAFFAVGIALMTVLRNSTVGMSSGIVFIVLGIVTMLRNRKNID
jgi:hypothetical protein